MTTETTAPKGYWEDANGAYIPVSKIKDIDKDRHRTVVSLVDSAKAQHAALAQFKAAAMKQVQDFIDRSLAQYDAKAGGTKGNVTLISFDGRYKIVRQMQETLVFDERLQAAKIKIDECIQSWSKGSNANIRTLINAAFQVDKAGKISTEKVLSLRRLNIDDPRWLQAMTAISDSITVASSKMYVRFYERNESGAYVAISLDLAAL